MSRRLPPLNALRAFETAARHLSFSKAAAELHVTPAAVSHQVKSLEEYLGIKMFRRLPSGLLLTDAAQACLPKLRESFDGLADAVERTRRVDVPGILNLSVFQSFAAKWLVPRLHRFHAAHPEIDLRIHASIRLVDLHSEDFDLAVRYGLGRWPDLCAERFMDEEVFPVCSPGLMQGPPPLRRPDDLCRYTLLHDVSFRDIFGGTFPDWHTWLEAAGVSGVDPTAGPGLAPSAMVIQAAIDGQGVALGRSFLVADDLASGVLMRPFDLSLPVPFGYYLVSPAFLANHPRVTAFRDWLFAEAVATRGAAGRNS